MFSEIMSPWFCFSSTISPSNRFIRIFQVWFVPRACPGTQFIHYRDRWLVTTCLYLYMKFNWPLLRSQPLTFLLIFQLQQISKRSGTIGVQRKSIRFWLQELCC
jgi:hypothetical protein